MTFAWPDPEQTMSRLKGFQRATVEKAFRRLFIDADSSRRFLVADETGLGKTLVARGVIARTLELLRDRLTDIGRIDVVYICSNAAIARQNLNRLNVTQDDEVRHATRLTLLPRVLAGLDPERCPVNFVSLTPGTSFEQLSRLGTVEERAVLFVLLQKAWRIKGDRALSVLQGNVQDLETFRDRVESLRDETWTRSPVIDDFRDALDAEAARCNSAGDPTPRERFDALRRGLRGRRKFPDHLREERRALVGQLRRLVARTCVRALEPDLVILDEFQRFKHLLSGEGDAAVLARELFEYEEGASRSHVLLLSATPYKMYTLRHQDEEDDHYEDFLATYEFLSADPRKRRELELDLGEFRRALLHAGGQDRRSLAEARDRVQSALRQVMCRTERTRADRENRGMLEEVSASASRLEPNDVRRFVHLSRVGHAVEERNVVEYWKSAPYPLEFMDEYRLKQRLRGALRRGHGDVHSALSAALPHQLSPEDLRRYARLDPGNARLRSLVSDLESIGAWRLLWLPPSLPYYRMSDAFEHARGAGFTKRLLFSKWRVVPRAVSALITYEAERTLLKGDRRRARNTPDAREKRKPLLTFTRSKGRLTGMPVFALLYPSISLAEIGARALSVSPADTPDAVVAQAAQDVRPRLDAMRLSTSDDGPPDERWYWAAPLLLDGPGATTWLARNDLTARISGAAEDEDADTRFGEHLEEALRVATGTEPLGRMPDDLATVVALLAVAAPGINALRSLARVAGGRAALDALEARDAAARVGWAFRSYLNGPEATAVVRQENRSVPYWRGVLRYSLGGCLAAVLDEQVHMLRDALGLFDAATEERCSAIATALAEALELRTSRVVGQLFHRGQDAGSVGTSDWAFRAHFALPFGQKEQTSDGEDARRDARTRGAFNSPFWPFVLASTSIGQEGLDFHTWSHAVVHWNLPSNPVDLEQREGRVHRYKGHAVRKNVALDFSGHMDRPRAIRELDDVWDALFRVAEERAAGHDGLVPYWLYAPENGARIERHVPLLPLSRDRLHLDDLRRTLAAYRMVFGQPRQDDLLEFLLRHHEPSELDELLDSAIVDLSPHVEAPIEPIRTRDA